MTEYEYTVTGPDYTDPDTQRRIMLEYLQLMIAREDWHGVADAAMDLREMEAETRGRTEP